MHLVVVALLLGGLAFSGRIIKVSPSAIQNPIISSIQPEQNICSIKDALETCDMGHQELLLFKTQLTFEQARCVCAEHDLDLAHLPDLELMSAGELAWNCLGQFNQIWIASTEHDRRDCLAFSIGNEAPTLADVLWLPCEGKNFFLCRKQKKF